MIFGDQYLIKFLLFVFVLMLKLYISNSLYAFTMIIVCQVEAVIHFEDDTEEMQQWDQQVPLFELCGDTWFNFSRFATSINK